MIRAIRVCMCVHLRSGVNAGGDDSNEVQDEQRGFAFRSRLWGSLRNGNGAAEWIKVELGGWFAINCRIFIADKLVYPGS